MTNLHLLKGLVESIQLQSMCSFFGLSCHLFTDLIKCLSFYSLPQRNFNYYLLNCCGHLQRSIHTYIFSWGYIYILETSQFWISSTTLRVSILQSASTCPENIHTFLTEPISPLPVTLQTYKSCIMKSQLCATEVQLALNKAGLNCTGPLKCRLYIPRFLTHRFNQSQIENSIFHPLLEI